MPIEEGKAAPAFTLSDQDGKKAALKDLKGQDVILYFYPKDDTPGCTKEACGFRDLWKRIQKRDAVVLEEGEGPVAEPVGVAELDRPAQIRRGRLEEAGESVEIVDDYAVRFETVPDVFEPIVVDRVITTNMSVKHDVFERFLPK